MARNYKGYAYFDNNPNIVKIFDDLDALLDFCRFELLPFDQSDLYNNQSPVWKAFVQTNKQYKHRSGPQRRKDR